MKTNKLFLLGFVVSVFFLIGCGDNGPSTRNNEYLGELPSLEKQYAFKIEEKTKALKENTDLETNFKLAKELELLKEERKTKIAEYATANPITKPLPFEALKGMPYTIKDVTVDKVSAGSLSIKFAIKLNEDIKNRYGGFEKYLFFYYKAVDAQGKEIQKSKTVATSFQRQPLKAGLEYDASGIWQTKAVQNMEDFAKVVEITKDEYSKK